MQTTTTLRSIFNSSLSRTRFLVSIACLCILSGCLDFQTSKIKTTNHVVRSETSPDENELRTIPKKGVEKTELSHLEEVGISMVVGTGLLLRNSESHDSEWNPVPPWTKQIYSLYPLEMNVQSPAEVTILPLEAGVPSFSVKLPKTEAIVHCSPEDIKWKVPDIEVTSEAHRRYREKKPKAFEFAVVHPSVSYFKHTKSVGNLASATLDSAFHPGTLEFAIDVSGDGVADVAKTRYCRDDASVHPDSLTGDRAKGGCYRCSSAFHRNDEGAWERTYSTGPC